jgi:hypothetical protein
MVEYPGPVRRLDRTPLSLDPPKGRAFRRSSVAGLTADVFATTTGKADLRRSRGLRHKGLCPRTPAQSCDFSSSDSRALTVAEQRTRFAWVTMENRAQPKIDRWIQA